MLKIRSMMIVVAITAIWVYIIAEGVKYRTRHVGTNSGWDSPE